MGYYIRRVDAKRSSPKWKVQFVSYKKRHSFRSNAKKPKKEWDIPKHQWFDLGFNVSMNLDQARARAAQLNAQEKSKVIEARQQEFVRNRRQFETECRAILPEFFRSQFENQFVFSHNHLPTQKDTRAHWRAAQKLLLKVALDPEDWFEHSQEFYDYLAGSQFSVSYSQKILRLVNLWGFFISKKFGKPFMPLPAPRGRHKRQLQEAYYRKRERYRVESDPLLLTVKNVFGNWHEQDYNGL